MSKQKLKPDEAFIKYVNEYIASFRAIKDEVEANQPNAVKARKKALKQIKEKRDELLTGNLGITAKQFDETPILFALRPRFFEMMDKDFETIDEWWEDPEGWLKHCQGYCADDIAIPFGSKKLKQPSCWS